MRFCMDHWNGLRAALDVRGLSALIPDNGEKAAAALADQVQTRTVNLDNFDPLMAAHMAIVSNLVTWFGPVVLVHPGCPICEANKAHALQCRDETCTLVDPTAYDWMLVRAADEQVSTWKSIGGQS